MAKAGSSKPTAQSGPSKGADKGFKGKGKPDKAIQKTIDLLKANEKRKALGKGKEKAVLGEVAVGIEQRKTLPGGISVERFAEARALEILALQNAIKSAAALGSTRAFQSLPRHLRRRAASHNPRRVPKRYRSRAAAEIQPGSNVVKLHRKRARQRAKGNPYGESRTEQLLKRQRNKTWLPTHVWHAKRFHMTNLWGYRLPRTPTLKSFRPAYRAARRNAIVNDVSYYGTIELVGQRDELVALLSRVIVGPFGGSKYESGARMAHGTIYEDQTFPYGLLGPIDILWRPEEEHLDARTIWLRIHPSIYPRTLDLLNGLIKAPSNVASSSSAASRRAITLDELRDELDSLEIMGPKAARRLRRILRLSKTEGKDKMKFFDGLRGVQGPELPDGMVTGLLVHDPRLIFPAPVLSTTESTEDEDGVLRSSLRHEPSVSLAQSSLWERSARDELSKPKFKKSDLDRRRQKLGVPGSQLRPGPQDDRIPIILVQRSITSPTSPNEAIHGFTMILPRGWSMYFLSSFVYAGCMIGGLVERRNQHREAGLPSFPEHYGSICPAGLDWETIKGQEERERWEKKPPAKRPQFGAMGTINPWAPDWGRIISDSSQSGDEEMELNVKKEPIRPEPWLFTSALSGHLRAIINSAGPASTLLKLVNAFRTQRSSLPLADSVSEELYGTALIHVKVEVEGRGSPGDMAILYSLDAIGRARWIEARDTDRKYGRMDWLAGSNEEPKAELQKLGEMTADDQRTIGYTSTGNFSLSRGHGFALATVSLRAYIEAAKIGGADGVLVKVKNRDGRLCRLAQLQFA